VTATAQPGPSPFKVDVAVKLVPKFSEQDVESFFLAFEKVAQLNRFSEDQYGAVLQAHLTGVPREPSQEVPRARSASSGCSYVSDRHRATKRCI